MEIFNNDSRTRVGELTAHIIEYLDTRWDLFILQLTEKGLTVVTGIVTVMIMLLFGSIVLIFASIGAAICLGQWLDNPAAGYFIMAAVFFILYFLINMFARNYIRVAVSNSLLESIKDTDIDNEIPTQL